MKGTTKKIIALLLAVMLVFALAACGTPSGGSGEKAPADSGEKAAASGEKPVIGLAMPTKEQPIWAAYGVRLKEAFENAGYTTILEYAEDVTERQVSQLENMMTRGAKYLVIAPVDTFAMTDICAKAKEDGIKVISCDRLIMQTKDVDYYVTFDLIRMGELMGEAIEKALDLKNTAGPYTIEFFSGSPDDSNSVPFYDGAMNILKPYLDNGKLVCKSGQVDLSVTGILKWDSATAQSRMDNLLGAYYNDGTKLDAVVAAADCLSMGVISSLDSFGYGKSDDMPFPIVTGQDCELTAIKSIMDGQQNMSVFLDPIVLAEKMLYVVDAMEKGEEVQVSTTYNNEVFDVPTILYDPVLIDNTNYELLVDRGFYTKEDLGIQ